MSQLFSNLIAVSGKAASAIGESIVGLEKIQNDINTISVSTPVALVFVGVFGLIEIARVLSNNKSFNLDVKCGKAEASMSAKNGDHTEKVSDEDRHEHTEKISIEDRHEHTEKISDEDRHEMKN